jgi:hypothetical protein
MTVRDINDGPSLYEVIVEAMKEPQPFIGDVRHSYPPGTKLTDMKNFDVWDGSRWVPSTETPTYLIQDNEK